MDKEQEQKSIESFRNLMSTVKRVAEKQCDKDKVPHNILVCVFLNASQDYFISSVEEIVNKYQSPENARTFIGVQMKLIQEWVKMAHEVDEQLEKLEKKK